MIKELVHDPIFLSQKSVDTNKDDKELFTDLMDTLMYYKDTCVGMAANLIGVKKNTIIVNDNGNIIIMNNPVILKKEKPYKAVETCLSYISDGTSVTRYKKIKVKYYDTDFTLKIKTYEDFTAQIIQHEFDHLLGILV